MTRVSSFGQTQMLLSGLMQNQVDLFQTQKQINTGRKTDEFQGMAGQTSSLLGAKSLQSRTETFQRILGSIEGQLAANDTQLGAILATARDFQDSILTVIAQDEAAAFAEIMTESFRFIANVLNTKIGGTFIFAGVTTNIPPVTSSDISDLIAAVSASDLFQNDGTPLKASVSDGVDIEFGLLADDMALQLFESFKRIAEFHANPATGPISGKLTTAQRTFLNTEFQALSVAIDQAQSVQVRNGLRQGRLETIRAQHTDTQLFLETFISNIQDVNMAEAVTQLSQNQLALEASFRSFSSITSLSLIDFI